MSVFGKYLSKMKLRQWKDYGYADSEKLQQEAAEKAEKLGSPKEEIAKKISEMEEAYENGEITEAQFLTYKEIQKDKLPVLPPSAGNTNVSYTLPKPLQKGEKIAEISSQDAFYPVNNNPFEKVDLPDVGEKLTQEDKIYLATKWGRLYSTADWVYLERKYFDFMDSFDIQGAARVDTLIQICKLSLKMNQSLDSMDLDAYSKLSRTYDALMKSAKFTEAQRKEEKAQDFDSIGQIVAFAEKNKGKISRYSIAAPHDKFDKALDSLKDYNKQLILNDPSIVQQLETYLKRRKAMEDKKMDEEAAKAAGLDYVPISDEDLEEYRESIAADKELDKEVYKDVE